MSPDFILITDYETHEILYVNDTACDMSEFSREELLKIQPHQLAGQSREEAAEIFTAAISAGPEGATAETHLATTKNGDRKGWWEPHHRGVRIDGRWVIVTVSRQVTGRVLAEQAALRTALIRNEFDLHYQAKLDLKTNRNPGHYQYGPNPEHAGNRRRCRNRGPGSLPA